MTIRVIPRYVDHLWYPILVKAGGGHIIREMQGREVNAWNDWVATFQTRTYPMGCI